MQKENNCLHKSPKCISQIGSGLYLTFLETVKMVVNSQAGPKSLSTLNCSREGLMRFGLAGLQGVSREGSCVCPGSGLAPVLTQSPGVTVMWVWLCQGPSLR